MRPTFQIITVCLSMLAGCVQTSIQPLTQSTFKVATQAAPACGQQGARDVAFKTAAIEVIKRGGDRFIIVGDQSGSRVSGGQYTGYGFYNTYNDNLQDMIVKVVSKGDPQYRDSLSARQTLGEKWQEIVAKGIPEVC
jgi:hypothetical protein